MEITADKPGAHTTASACGTYLASVVKDKVHVCYTNAPETTRVFPAKNSSKEITGLRWSPDGSLVASCSAKCIEVFDLDDVDRKVRLDNGGGGLGRFTSADFIGNDQLLTIWEFSRAKLWNLENGKGIELGDIKTTCDGPSWQARPMLNDGSVQTLAMLSREGAEDVLMVYFPQSQKSLPPVKLSTIDAQSIQWSPDGRWLTVRDTPIARPSSYVYTPDGHLFRSYPGDLVAENNGLGVKAITWSADSSQLALSNYDGRTILLDTRTFTPMAIIEHSTTIDQSHQPPEHRAPVWEEVVSASRERIYTLRSHPVSPPLFKPKPGTEPGEVGVAEACFNCDTSYLATRDERMLNTIWIWDMKTLCAHVVLIQHCNVRKMHWHDSRPETLLLDSGNSIACLFDAKTCEIPVSTHVQLGGTPAFSWLHTPSHAKSAILCASKTSFSILFPEGRDEPRAAQRPMSSGPTPSDAAFEEGESEDSIMEMLSGRRPLPPKTEPSYTEMVDLEASVEDSNSSIRLDDTFRAKQKAAVSSAEADPLDDSDIF